MTTIREVIAGSLRLLELLGAGETPEATDAADALAALNAMVDSWTVEGGKIWTEVIEQFTLTSGNDTYTIGPSGDFNTTLPINIRAATVNLTSGTTTMLEVMSAEEFAYEPDKFISGRPYGFYYNAGYPLGTLKFYYKPNQNYVFTLYSEKALSTFSSINDTIIAPPGWVRALKYNLAVELAPEYGKVPKQDVSSIAVESKTAVENYASSNNKNTQQVDEGLLSNVNKKAFNIWSNR